MTDFHCPISAELEEHQQAIQDHSQDIIAALRQIRQEMNHCNQCPQQRTCQQRSQLTAQIKSAIEEIVDQWNLTEIPKPS